MVAGISSADSRSGSQRIASMSNSMVRLALVASVAWTSLLVRFQTSQESTVPHSQIAALGAPLAVGYVVQKPPYLGAGEVGVYRQSRLGADGILQSRRT